MRPVVLITSSTLNSRYAIVKENMRLCHSNIPIFTGVSATSYIDMQTIGKFRCFRKLLYARHRFQFLMYSPSQTGTTFSKTAGRHSLWQPTASVWLLPLVRQPFAYGARIKVKSFHRTGLLRPVFLYLNTVLCQ